MRCWTCGGEPLTSGRVCICGGSGFHDDEVRNLRLQVLSLEKKLEDIRDMCQWGDALSDEQARKIIRLLGGQC